MEIDITDFFNDAEPGQFSGSVAELGENAGRITWAASIEQAGSAPMLVTEEALDALRSHARGYGAWEDDEIAAWTPTECNAFFIQEVASNMREIESLCMGDDGETDWDKYESLSSKGTIHGNLFKGGDERIYYYLGN